MTLPNHHMQVQSLGLSVWSKYLLYRPRLGIHIYLYLYLYMVSKSINTLAFETDGIKFSLNEKPKHFNCV